MAGQANYSLRASLAGIQQAKSVCLSSAQKVDQLRGKISRSTMQQFLTGELLDQEVFQQICHTLELNWEEIAELPSPAPNQENNGHGLTPEVLSPWAQLRKRLCTDILQRYQFINLLNQEQLAIASLQFDVHLLEALPRHILVDVASYLQEFNPDQNFERFGLGEQQERIPALEAVQQYSRLLILGQPFSGKSLFLKYLAVCCAQSQIFVDHLPVFLDLRTYAVEDLESTHAIEEVIRQTLDLEDLTATSTLLQQGNLLLLIDNLEHIPESARRNIQFQLRLFAQRYSQNRFLVTFRTELTDYTFPTFRPVEMAKMSQAQIEHFIQVWFQEAEYNAAIDTSGTAEQLIAELRFEKNDRLASLAQKPMLLHLLCWMFQYLGHLPRSQFSLYELGITRTLELWEESPQATEEATIYSKLNLIERYRLLSCIAILSFQDKELFFSIKHAKKYIGKYLKTLAGFSTGKETLAQYSARVLKEIEQQHGLIFERTHGVYSFASISIHEFFLSHYLLQNFDPNNLYRSLGAPIPQTWYKLFANLSQEMRYIDDFLLHVKHKIDQIVAKDKKIQIFLSWVNQKSMLVKVPYKAAAVRAFYFSQAIDHLFDPRISRPIDFSHAVNRALRSSLHDWSLACMLDRALDRAFNNNVIEQLSIEFIVDLILNCLLVTLAHDLNLFMTYAEDRRLDIDPALKEVLYKLKSQVPNRDKYAKSYEKWWNENSKLWIKKLRLVIIEYRNIGYDWQFNQEQRECLRQYYNANKLLVESMFNNTRLQPQTSEELEATLLLPTM
jgi:predicted NACHT family NTPase